MNVATHSQPKPMTFGRIVRRLPLYFGLAFAGLAVAAAVVAVSVHFRVHEISGGWFGFVGYTGLLFWVVVRHGGSHWHRPYFWLITFALLATHCSVFVAILRVYPQFRMVWFWPITIVESGIIGGTIEWLFPEEHIRHQRTDEL